MLFYSTPSVKSTDLDKSWDGIRWIIEKSCEENGFEKIDITNSDGVIYFEGYSEEYDPGEHAGYPEGKDPISYYSEQEIKRIVDTLEAIGIQKIYNRYNSIEMHEDDVYGYEYIDDEIMSNYQAIDENDYLDSYLYSFYQFFKEAKEEKFIITVGFG